MKPCILMVALTCTFLLQFNNVELIHAQTAQRRAQVRSSVRSAPVDSSLNTIKFDIVVLRLNSSEAKREAIVKDFSGSVADVEKKIKEMSNLGRIQSSDRFEVNSVDGYPTSYNRGQRIGFQSGQVTSRGRTSQSFQYEETGTTLQLTGAIKDQKVLVRIELEMSIADKPEKKMDEEDESAQLAPPTLVQLSVMSSMVIKGTNYSANVYSQGSETWVVAIGATIEE